MSTKSTVLAALAAASLAGLAVVPAATAGDPCVDMTLEQLSFCASIHLHSVCDEPQINVPGCVNYAFDKAVITVEYGRTTYNEDVQP